MLLLQFFIQIDRNQSVYKHTGERNVHSHRLIAGGRGQLSAHRVCLRGGSRASECLSWCQMGSQVQLWPEGEPEAVHLPQRAEVPL